MKKFNQYFWLLLTLSVSACSCPDGSRRQSDFSWVYNSTCRDVRNKMTNSNKPNIDKSDSQLRSGEEVAKELQGYMFEKGKDDSNLLLNRARNGDRQALRKLIMYVEQDNPKWRHAPEIYRITAMNQGGAFIAKYYKSLSLSKIHHSEKEQFEAALKQVEGKAENGDWVAAAGLYTLVREFSFIGVALPWENEKSLSQHYLKLVHRFGPERGLVDNLIEK